MEALGGPQPQSSIEFDIISGSDSVASVLGSGLVEALAIGSIRVRAQAVGMDEETGETVVYSQDEGEVTHYSILFYGDAHLIYC